LEPKKSFRDEQFYLGSNQLNHYRDKGLSIREGRPTSIEDVMLDIIPDDANAIFKKKNVLKWDQRKRNFVKVTGKDITRKVLKNESGKVIKIKNRAGRAYDDWEKTSKMKIGRIGELEETSNLSYLKNQELNGRMRTRLGLKKNNIQVDDEIKTKEEILLKKKEKLRNQQIHKGIKRKRLSSNTPRESKRRRGAPGKAKVLLT